MTIIASDAPQDLAAMLEGYDCPAILVTADYHILATNALYRDSFGEIDTQAGPARCYQVSHGYSEPCDRAGESCPLAASIQSGGREKVLHIHQTPRGQEHVNVELVPIHSREGTLKYFVELLKPVAIASARISGSQMVGSSPAFNDMLENITRVGPTDASVLLLGESGTGKELAALAIHQASKRHMGPLVTLECSGLSETLFESELFGHVKGAFTGASFNSPGLAAAADGGTLFLDEIGDVSAALQVKLLRLIETGTYRPVGSRDVKRSDFRLICATHQDIHNLVQSGEFRRDLFFRINVFPIYLPALHERAEDIPLLAKSMLAKSDGKYILTDSAVKRLKAHTYTGNIRELRNILARATVLANSNVIDGDVIARCLTIDRPLTQRRDEAGGDLREHERQHLMQLLDQHQGDKEKAARAANISVRTLYRKLRSEPDAAEEA